MKKILLLLLLVGCVFFLTDCTQKKKEAVQPTKTLSAAERNKAAGEAFMDSIAKEDGIGHTASGLCYKVLTMGQGEVPTRDDRVIVHYRGTLIDGTEFDSSYSRGTPAVFGVTDVIPGWTEALTMMPVDSKWILYLPQQLAYGDRRLSSQILPYSAMVFEVELLGIVK